MRRKKSRTYRGVFEDKKAPRNGKRHRMRWILKLRVRGVLIQIRVCSPEEGLFVRQVIEQHVRPKWARGEWSSICFPDPLDLYDVCEGYLSICGRTFRLSERWNNEKQEALFDGWWFSVPGKLPHDCRVVNASGRIFVRRVPLDHVIGPVVEVGHRPDL